VTIALVASVLVHGPWPLRMLRAPGFVAGRMLNTSLGWVGLVLAGPLFVIALERKGATLALAVSPLLSPYVLGISWVGFLLGLAEHAPWLLAGLCVVSWVLILTLGQVF
jgi:hypothetical protein